MKNDNDGDDNDEHLKLHPYLIAVIKTDYRELKKEIDYEKIFRSLITSRKNKNAF